MKRVVLPLLAVLLGLTPILMIQGCNDETKQVIQDNQQLILDGLTMAASQGTERGLKEWAKKDEAAAKEAAVALSRNLKDSVLPYLEGDTLKPSSEVNEFINSSLFKDVPDEVKTAISGAAALLDLYLPVPGSDQLKPEQLAYLKAFLTGVQEGAAKYSGSANTREVKPRNWITGEQKNAMLLRKGAWVAG